MDVLGTFANSLNEHFDELRAVHEELGTQYDATALIEILKAAMAAQMAELVAARDQTLARCQEAIEQARVMQRSTGAAALPAGLEVTRPLLACAERLDASLQDLRDEYNRREALVLQMSSELRAVADELGGNYRIECTIYDRRSSALLPDASDDYIRQLSREHARALAERASRVERLKELRNACRRMRDELEEGGHGGGEADEQDEEGTRVTLQTIQLVQSEHDELLQQRQERCDAVQQAREVVEALWTKLQIPSQEQTAFTQSTHGITDTALRAWHAELDRLAELKRQHLDLFIQDCRSQLQQLWEQLYFSEEEMLEFLPAHNAHPATDEALAAHEAEVDRLQGLVREREPVLALLAKHIELCEERRQLEISSRDASRLTGKGARGDPGRLLREEKIRKRIARELPRVAARLRDALGKWDREHGAPFLVWGETYHVGDNEAGAARMRAGSSESLDVVSGAASASRTRTLSGSSSAEHVRPVPSATPSRSSSHSQTSQTLPLHQSQARQGRRSAHSPVRRDASPTRAGSSSNGTDGSSTLDSGVTRTSAESGGVPKSAAVHRPLAGPAASTSKLASYKAPSKTQSSTPLQSRAAPTFNTTQRRLAKQVTATAPPLTTTRPTVAASHSRAAASTISSTPSRTRVPARGAVKTTPLVGSIVRTRTTADRAGASPSERRNGLRPDLASVLHADPDSSFDILSPSPAAGRESEVVDEW